MKSASHVSTMPHSRTAVISALAVISPTPVGTVQSISARNAMTDNATPMLPLPCVTPIVPRLVAEIAPSAPVSAATTAILSSKMVARISVSLIPSLLLRPSPSRPGQREAPTFLQSVPYASREAPPRSLFPGNSRLQAFNLSLPPAVLWATPVLLQLPSSPPEREQGLRGCDEEGKVRSWMKCIRRDVPLARLLWHHFLHASAIFSRMLPIRS